MKKTTINIGKMFSHLSLARRTWWSRGNLNVSKYWTILRCDKKKLRWKAIAKDANNSCCHAYLSRYYNKKSEEKKWKKSCEHEMSKQTPATITPPSWPKCLWGFSLLYPSLLLMINPRLWKWVPISTPNGSETAKLGTNWMEILSECD